jgi:hypothetical protein
MNSYTGGGSPGRILGGYGYIADAECDAPIDTCNTMRVFFRSLANVDQLFMEPVLIYNGYG